MQKQKVEISSQPAKKVSLQPLVYPKRWVVSPQILILSCILIFALMLGMIGLNHGLPYSRKVDEYRMATIAGRMAANNSPHPGWFGHPGSTLIYPLACVYKLWGSVSYEIPIWQENPDLYELLREDPARAEHFEPDWAVYYLIGRGLNILYFVAGIVITYLVGVRTWDKRVALLAAWFMAITPILLYYASIMRTDQAGLLFFMLGFLACFRPLSSRKWYGYAIAGIAIGVAGSSRYFNLSLGATLILAHFLAGAHHERGHWKRLIIGLIAIGFGFLITTPAFVFSLRRVYRNLLHESRAAIIPLTHPGKLWWYLSFALPDALTWPVWLLAIAGMFLAWRERNKKAILLMFGFIVFLLTIVIPSRYQQRWIVAVIPVGLLFAARALWTGIDALTGYKSGLTRWGQPVAVLLISALSVVPLKESIRHVYLMTQPNTQILSTQWIEENLPPGSRIAREVNTGIIPDDDFSITFSHRLFELGPFDETLTQQYDYFVASSDGYQRFFKVADLDPERVEFYEEPLAFYEKLFENELVAEFKPDPWKTAGPMIRI